MRFALRPDDPRLLSPNERIPLRAAPNPALAPVRASVLVKAKPERAFQVFAHELGRWWPRGFTFSGEQRFAAAGIEPVPGGRWFECDDTGREISWGDVRAYVPGKRLVLSWAISAYRTPEAPRHASEIEVRFSPEGRRTRVAIEHRLFGRHGEGAVEMRAGMASPLGWGFILDAYAKAVAGK